MSSIAIVTIGAATTGSVLLSAAFLALGLGIGIGFYIAFKKSLDRQNREKLLSEIRNLSYRTRSDITRLGSEAVEKLSGDVNEIEKIEAEMEESLEKNAMERFERSAILFHEKIMEVRQKIELARLNLLELPSEIKKYGELLEKAFASETLDRLLASDRPEMDDLKREFQKAAGMDDLLRKKALLEEIYRKADKLVRRGAAAQSAVTSLEEDIAAGLSYTPKTREELVSETHRYLELLRELDSDTYEDVKPLAADIEKETYLQRILMVADNVKLRYGRLKEAIAWTAVHRDALGRLLEETRGYELSGPLADELERIIGKKRIDREEFRSFSLRAAEFILEAEKKLREEEMKRELALKIKTRLEELGYAVTGEEKMIADIENGGIVYLDTKWSGYKVMLRLDENGELATRMVRVVPSAKERDNISDYQKEKDREITRQWCRDYDGFLEKLREAGLRLEIKLRKEPEEEDVLYMINAELSKSRKKLSATDGLPAEKRLL